MRIHFGGALDGCRVISGLQRRDDIDAQVQMLQIGWMPTAVVKRLSALYQVWIIHLHYARLLSLVLQVCGTDC
jgi:hypothetical protein